MNNGHGMHGYPICWLLIWDISFHSFHFAWQFYAAQRSNTSNRAVLPGCTECGNPHHWTNRITITTLKHPQAASIASHCTYCTLDQVPLALSRNMALQPPLEIGKGQGVLKCGQRLKGKHRKNVVLPQHPQLKPCGTEMGSAACKFTTCFAFHIFHDLFMFFQHAWFWHLAHQHTHYLSVQSKARIR